MITTKVRQLTGNNVWALRSVEDIHITEGKTYVIFDGDPRQALAAVEATMAAQGTCNAIYRSLVAVRRKLRATAGYQPQDSVTGVTKLTDYVQIAR